MVEFNSEVFRHARLTVKPTKLCVDTHIDHSTVSVVAGNQYNGPQTHHTHENYVNPNANRRRDDDRLIILAMLTAGIVLGIMNCFVYFNIMFF
jgi:hypothetical protein